MNNRKNVTDMKDSDLARRNRTSSPRRRRFCRGAAAVEFAIVAPVFFMLVMGSIELGRALMVQQVITNASRVGVREAIALNTSESDVINIATNYAAGGAVPGVLVNVSPSPAAAAAGDEITVNVSIPYADVSWIPSPWFLGGATLQASSVMRKEGFE